jgi:hypothetical protein
MKLNKYLGSDSFDEFIVKEYGLELKQIQRARFEYSYWSGEDVWVATIRDCRIEKRQSYGPAGCQSYVFVNYDGTKTILAENKYGYVNSISHCMMSNIQEITEYIELLKSDFDYEEFKQAGA